MGTKKNGLELYLHIPFCIKKCDYCDFLSGPSTRAGQEAYIYALLREMETVSKNLKKRPVDTVFIGGGTPSVPECDVMEKLLQGLRDYFLFSADAEVTIEANPGTLTPEKLSIYRKYGINRISIGLQSPNNKELAMLGRIHNYAQFLESFQMARAAGFSNINVDLMFAIPGQCYEDWIENLRMVAALGPEHISAYSLIVEEGTPLFGMVERSGGDILPTEDEDRQMYALTKKILADAGYHRYEISNYARPGFECRHNASYWERTDYIGFGVAAASLLKKSKSYPQSRRFTNTSDLESYIKNPIDNHSEEELLTQKDEMEEFVFLGLRMMAGISTESFKEVFGRDFYEVYGDIAAKQMKQGLIKREGSRIRLTDMGIDVSNTVMAEYML